MDPKVRAILRPMFLFDVADSIRGIEQAEGKPARSPRYLGFDPPPRILDGGDARIALFTFGVVGVTLTIPFEGTWEQLTHTASALLDDAGTQAKARSRACEALSQVDAAGSYKDWLSEDYLIVELAARRRDKTGRLL